MTYIPNILIVDDEPRMCESIAEMLSQCGYQPKIICSGHEAIEYISKQNVDIVLLDLLMPEVDGFQVFDNIIRMNPDTLVIIMTGTALFGSAVEALRRGAYNYLRKPFEPIELLKIIENAVENIKLKNIRKKTEEALRKGEKLFRELVENSLVGVCIIQHGKIVYMNPEQKRLFGDLPKFYDFKRINIHPDDSKIFKQYCDLIYAYRMPAKDIEMRFFPYSETTKEKRLNWVNCRTSVIDYQSDQAILINMIDISRSKELENRIQIREKMASLGQVATSIAHEIRSPLSGISLLLDCIAESSSGSEGNEETLDFICQAKEAAKKIESVIKRVLNFSKPNRYQFKFTDINSLIRELIMLSHAVLKNSGITVELEMAEGLPKIYLDAQLIEQVLLNLINNAMEAAKGLDQKVIRIVSSWQENEITLKISDSGEGIPPDNLDKIFNPFFTTRPDGSGIGLSLCQKIITNHGGTIDVSSPDGQGAEFIIRMPIEKRAIKR